MLTLDLSLIPGDRVSGEICSVDEYEISILESMLVLITILSRLIEYLGKKISRLTLQLSGYEHDRFLACLFSSATSL